MGQYGNTHREFFNIFFLNKVKDKNHVTYDSATSVVKST